MQNPNMCLARTLILDKLWDGGGSFVDDNTLSVYVRRLRSKIEDDPEIPLYLLTIRGVGYKWNVVK
jgi:DNA-binding response OmpR family regulator